MRRKLIHEQRWYVVVLPLARQGPSLRDHRHGDAPVDQRNRLREPERACVTGSVDQDQRAKSASKTKSAMRMKPPAPPLRPWSDGSAVSGPDFSMVE
jgi:hypothetical protein